jgi:hypothetical protein
MNTENRDAYITSKLEEIKGVLSAAIDADPDISLLKVEAREFILGAVVTSGKDSLFVMFRTDGYSRFSRNLKVTFGDYGNRSSLRESKVGWTEPKRIKQIIDKAKKHLAVERDRREERERNMAQRRALVESHSTLREEFPEAQYLLDSTFGARKLSLKLIGDEEYMRKVLKVLTDADLLGRN